MSNARQHMRPLSACIVLFPPVYDIFTACCLSLPLPSPSPKRIRLDTSQEDVVDGDVDELDEETDEAHDQEPHACGIGNSGEFCNKMGD